MIFKKIKRNEKKRIMSIRIIKDIHNQVFVFGNISLKKIKRIEKFINPARVVAKYVFFELFNFSFFFCIKIKLKLILKMKLKELNKGERI